MALVPFPGAAAPDDDDPHIHLTDPDVFEDAGAKMSFLDHLDELRKRLINCVIALVVGCVIAFIFINRIFEFVMVPLYQMLPPGGTLIFTQGGEAFMLYMKVGALAGLIIAIPLILIQVWLFIAPGLYANEKRLAIPFVTLSTAGFISGTLVNHYLTFPFLMKFFASFNTDDLQFLPKLDDVFDLYTKMLLGMGAVFQMPTIVYFLAKMRLVTARFLLRHFKYAFLIIFIVAAVITPSGDMITQTIFAAPMLVLYALSILIAWLVAPKRAAD